MQQSNRDTFLLNSYHGDFCDSAYIKYLYDNTFGNDDGGFLWKFAELELVTVVEGAKVFVQATYFLEGDGIRIRLLETYRACHP